ADIDFTGNQFVEKGVLATHVRSSKAFLGLLGGKFNPMLADLDVTALEEYYKSYGYHKAHVAREVQWAADHSRVVLVCHVEEEPRYRLDGRPQVVGVGREFPMDLVQAIPQVQPGEYYEQNKVEGDVNAIKDYYGKTGRDVRVRSDLVYSDKSPGVCQVVYKVEEHAPVHVGTIFIVGNEVTRQDIILKQLPDGLAPGQILS